MISGKIQIRLVLLLFCFLIICMLNVALSQPIPSPVPTPTYKEAISGKELAKKLWMYGEYAKIITNNWELTSPEKNTWYKPVELSSRSGNLKPDFVIDNLAITVRSIWPAMIDWKTNWPFWEKEFYKSFFSVAADIDGLNKIIKQKYSSPKPKIKKGSVVYMVVFDPSDNSKLFCGFGKINTDTKKDLNRSFDNPEFQTDKICLAVDSAKWQEKFQGKKVLLQFFCTNQVSSAILKQAKISQGTIERPMDMIEF